MPSQAPPVVTEAAGPSSPVPASAKARAAPAPCGAAAAPIGARRADPPPPRSPGTALPLDRVLARAVRGRVLQRDLAVHVRQSNVDPNIVEELLIGPGRPAGLFTAHKSHTTSWQVAVDTVRAAVVGQPIRTAVSNVKMLLAETLGLPGTALAGHLQSDASGRYGTAQQEANAVRRLRASDLVTLRRAVRAFLTLRNVVPLSAVDRGSFSTGAGEATRAADLRRLDRPKTRQPAKQAPAAERARAAIWGLLDLRAIRDMLDARTTTEQLAMKPSASPAPTRTNLAARTVAQHLQSIEMAYPNAFALASSGGHDWTQDFRDVAGKAGVASDTELASVQRELRSYLVRRPTAMASRTANPAPDADLSVEVALAGDGTVSSLTAAGRPPTSLGGSRQGSHLVAFSLHLAVLRRLIVGQDVEAAIAAVAAKIAEDRDDVETTHDANFAVLVHTARAIYDTASQAASAAETHSANRALDAQARLEHLCIAWLGYVNASPLASVSKGGLAEGAGEASVLQNLTAAEAASFFPIPEHWDVAWGLLDTAALGGLVARRSTRGPLLVGMRRNPLRSTRPSPARMTEDVRAEDPVDYPGMTDDSEADGAYVIARYLDSLERAFPVAYEAAELWRPEATVYMLCRMNISKDAIRNIVATLDFRVDDDIESLITEHAGTAVGGKRKGDDAYGSTQPNKRARVG